MAEKRKCDLPSHLKIVFSSIPFSSSDSESDLIETVKPPDFFALFDVNLHAGIERPSGNRRQRIVGTSAPVVQIHFPVQDIVDIEHE